MNKKSREADYDLLFKYIPKDQLDECISKEIGDFFGNPYKENYTETAFEADMTCVLRAKSKDTGKFVYGFPKMTIDRKGILGRSYPDGKFHWIEVEGTRSSWKGIYDDFGNPVFGNDVIRCWDKENPDRETIALVMENRKKMSRIGCFPAKFHPDTCTFKVFDTIIDNLELEKYFDSL